MVKDNVKIYTKYDHIMWNRLSTMLYDTHGLPYIFDMWALEE